MCQIESPEGWNKECYELIGRTDLARQNGGRRKNVRAGRSSVSLHFHRHSMLLDPYIGA